MCPVCFSCCQSKRKKKNQTRKKQQYLALPFACNTKKLLTCHTQRWHLKAKKQTLVSKFPASSSICLCKEVFVLRCFCPVFSPSHVHGVKKAEKVKQLTGSILDGFHSCAVTTTFGHHFFCQIVLLTNRYWCWVLVYAVSKRCW